MRSRSVGANSYCIQRKCLCLSLACDRRARNFPRIGKLDIPYSSVDTCVSRMVHLDKLRIGPRETAYPELCIPEAFWPDDRTQALTLYSGDECWEGTHCPVYETSHVKLSNPWIIFKLVLLKKPKPQYNNSQAFRIESPPKKNRSRRLFSSQMTSQIRALAISWMTGIQRLRSAYPKILRRQDAPCYAFLDDCIFPYIYSFHVGNSTEPETVANWGRVGVQLGMSEGKRWYSGRVRSAGIDITLGIPATSGIGVVTKVDAIVEAH